jgi:hypothetical protein
MHVKNEKVIDNSTLQKQGQLWDKKISFFDIGEDAHWLNIQREGF